MKRKKKSVYNCDPEFELWRVQKSLKECRQEKIELQREAGARIRDLERENKSLRQGEIAQLSFTLLNEIEELKQRHSKRDDDMRELVATEKVHLEKIERLKKQLQNTNKLAKSFAQQRTNFEKESENLRIEVKKLQKSEKSLEHEVYLLTDERDSLQLELEQYNPEKSEFKNLMESLIKERDYLRHQLTILTRTSIQNIKKECCYPSEELKKRESKLHFILENIKSMGDNVEEALTAAAW